MITFVSMMHGVLQAQDLYSAVWCPVCNKVLLEGEPVASSLSSSHVDDCLLRAHVVLW
jgi:hypothetical protein